MLLSRKKYLRANQGSFMTKKLQKAIMARSRPRNIFLKEKTESSKNRYKKQRNYCVNLLKKAKKDHYNSLDIKTLADNRKFWQTVKPLFSDKIKSKENITLVYEEEIIDNDENVAIIFNSYFSNIVENLGIIAYEESKENKLPINTFHDPIESANVKYQNHPSIISIKERMGDLELLNFRFKTIGYQQVLEEINNLDSKKASQKADIPIKVIKLNTDIITNFVFHNFNNSLSSSNFPLEMKQADVIPIFKKGDKTDKENYRPISILTILSKIYERLIYEQIYPYFDHIFSKYQCGFRKGYSAQHCLLSMIEKWRRALDNGENIGALLTDLSKAFDCIDHGLLIAKLSAYGLDRNATKLFYSYLNERKQRVKINMTYSHWDNITTGVPQGSILGPFLFNIYICDLFIQINNIEFAGYADDNTPYTSSSEINTVLKSLESVSSKMFKWFSSNHLKANADKCHLITNFKSPVKIDISGSTLIGEDRVKLLGVDIDGNLNFDYHVNKLCNKASKKCHALARVCKYMTIEKKRTLMNAFIKSQFSYCPLIWMFHSRTINQRINKIHERALKLVYCNDRQLSFENLLQKDNTVSIHQRNLQALALEIFKVKNGYSPQLLTDNFEFADRPYDLRNPSVLKRKKDRTVFYGSESVSSLAPKIWELLPNSMKCSNSLKEFKSFIKLWTTDKCPCRLCKTYIYNLGFI